MVFVSLSLILPRLFQSLDFELVFVELVLAVCFLLLKQNLELFYLVSQKVYLFLVSQIFSAATSQLNVLLTLANQLGAVWGLSEER